MSDELEPGPAPEPEEKKHSTLDVMFSSKSREWNTPRDLFDHLNRTFHFQLDACADVYNSELYALRLDAY